MYADPLTAANLLHTYLYNYALLDKGDPLLLEGMQRVHRVLGKEHVRKTLDLVVCFCDADLTWLEKLALEPGVNRLPKMRTADKHIKRLQMAGGTNVNRG